MTRKQQIENRLLDLIRFRDNELKSPNGSQTYIDDLELSIKNLQQQLEATNAVEA